MAGLRSPPPTAPCRPLGFDMFSCYADVAQLVEHNLAKVGVAGSNPVVRSEGALGRVSLEPVPGPGRVAEWLRQGPAKPCTRVRFPPRPQPPERTTTP